MRQEAVLQWMKRTVDDLSACLTEQGRRDLRETQFSELEDEVCAAADLLVRQVLPVMLRQQAAQVVDGHDCPRCRGALDDKPDQTTSLETRRGRVHWRQPVRRCKTCRRDFFPSGESTGL